MALSPADLAPAVRSVEDASGDPYAISPKGAIGPYQIMPELARQYGYQRGDLFNRAVQDDIYNRHMGHLLNKYGGDARRALWAWNAGEGNVAKGIMPAETRAYVPKVLSRLGGAVSGLLGEGTAEAAETPKFQYSRSTGTFWRTGPDGNPVQVPIDQVPAAIRAKVAKLGAAPALGKDKLPPRVPTTAPSWEQQYERGFVAKLPTPLQYVAPGTMGEAAATGANAAALYFAPETFGASALLPIAAAGVGGYLEPSDQPWLSGQRFERAGIEASKEAGGLLGTKALGKGLEWGGRLANKIPMLKRSSERIGTGLTKLFNKYPLKEAPTTIEQLTDDVANGVLTDAAGHNLGQLRDKLEATIPPYVPGRAAKMQHGLLISPAVAAKGEKFTVYDVGADGKLFKTDMSIGDAITHQRTMTGASYTPAGGPKGAETSWAHREAAHKTREAIYNRLNQIGAKYGMPNAGDEYKALSADYGTAAILEKAFKGARRSVGVGMGQRAGFIDQPTLMKRVDKEVSHLARLQGHDKARAFQRAIAPTLAAAQEESGGGRVRRGLAETILSFLHGPYAPEERTMLPWYARAATARRGKVPVTRALTTPFIATPSALVGGYLPSSVPSSVPNPEATP